jgi:hypothetical protein
MPVEKTRTCATSALAAMLALCVAASGHAQEAAADCTAQVDVEMAASREGVPPGPVLSVAMRCRTSAPASFFVDGWGPQAMGSVRDGAGRVVERDGMLWHVAPQDGIVTLRYRLDLGALARGIGRVAVAVSRNEACWPSPRPGWSSRGWRAWRHRASILR